MDHSWAVCAVPGSWGVRLLLRFFIGLVVVFVIATVATSVQGASPQAPVAAQCSVEAGPAATLSFTNRKSQSISIYGVDSQCREIFYHTLLPGASYTQTTTELHPWRMRDRDRLSAVERAKRGEQVRLPGLRGASSQFL